jgi:hypothetical protein
MLTTWRITPQKNPEFRTSVWARLDAARRPSTWSMFARTHPAIVGAMMLTAIVAGAWSGRTEANERTEADRAKIAANYVHALDARWTRQQ